MSANPQLFRPRAVPRYALTEPLEVSLETIGSATLLDLSVLGARVGHDVRLVTGEDVRLQLKVPEIGCAMTLRGRVIWSRDASGFDHAGSKHVSGIEFCEAVHALKVVLDRLCSRRGASRIDD